MFRTYHHHHHQNLGKSGRYVRCFRCCLHIHPTAARVYVFADGAIIRLLQFIIVLLDCKLAGTSMRRKETVGNRG